MKAGKVLFFAFLVLCLISTAACQAGVQISGEQEEQLAPSLSAGTETALEPEQKQILIPAGVVTGSSDEGFLNFSGLDGQIIAVIEAPGVGSVDPEHIHPAGKFSEGDLPIPFVYHSWEPEQALMVNAQDDILTLRKTNSFLALAGAPGQSVLAFSEVTIDNDAPHTYLYAGSLDTLNSVVPFYDLVDEPTQMALSPISVEVSGGSIQGVWYTKTGWGIGGVDLIFPITRGLYYYDLINGENLQYIDPERSYQGISPDHS